MQRPPLAREYEVPKKPIFLLDNMNIVQSTDAATFVVDSVLDNVMYGTNGNIGLRHRTNSETVEHTTEIMINGVHHLMCCDNPRTNDTAPKTKQVGALVGVAHIDVLIDEVSGTLSAVPIRRLSLRDGSYRSLSQDVMSADGGLYFDSEYTRVVSNTDLNLWGAELVCKNFRFRPLSAPSSDIMGEGSLNTARRWNNGLYDVGSADSGRLETNLDGLTNNNNNTISSSSTSSLHPRLLTVPSYKVEMVATFVVDLDEWDVIKADRMDEIWQRSLTSQIGVITSTMITCNASYKSGVNEVDHEVSMSTAMENADEEVTPLIMRRLSHSGAFAKARHGENKNYFNNNNNNNNTTTEKNGNNETSMSTLMMMMMQQQQQQQPQQQQTSPSSYAQLHGHYNNNNNMFSRVYSLGGNGMSNMAGSNSNSGVSTSYDNYVERNRNLTTLSSTSSTSDREHQHHRGIRGGGAGGNNNNNNNNTFNSSNLSQHQQQHHRRLLHKRENGNPYDLLTLNTKERNRLIIKKTFIIHVRADDIPESITLTFEARHFTDNVPAPSPFPSMATMITQRQQSLEEFWRKFDVNLQLQEELIPNRARLPLLYNAFRLFGVTYNLRSGLTRSGCSCIGEGLEYDLGQYIYHGIYFTLTQPEFALSLLKSVFRLLPQARINAKNISLTSGAIYPSHTITGNNYRVYKSINNARFHVNAEIGYLIYIYFAAVDNISVCDRFMLLEMMLETARVWVPLGEWTDDHNTFRLDNLSGADEYNNCTSGNFYIHLSAKMHLRHAVELLRENDKALGTSKVNELLNTIKMTRHEVAEMEEVSNSIYIHRDDHLKVYMMHDSFDALAEWTEPNMKHPLHVNYHPLAVYRKKVINIPEVPFAMLLYEDEFEPCDFENNYRYYLPLCTFDAPEALGIMAITQCRAKMNFAQPIPALRSLSCIDLDNILYTSEEGLRFSAMSMSLLTLICGMGGVKFSWEALHLNPILPAGVIRYSFTVRWRGAVLRTSLDNDQLVYELISGDSLRFIHGPSQHRIHLHTGFRRCQAVQKCTIPRHLSSPMREFDGAIIFSDCLFHNLLEFSYLAWLRTLETLFDSYRALQNRPIPPLNPEEFINEAIYQVEDNVVAFTGINNVLRHRNIFLDLGTPEDAEIVETRHGLANAKVAEMSELMAREKPAVNQDLFTMLKAMAKSGVALAIVTYSRSLRQLMQHYCDLAGYFVAMIDGEEAHDRRIKGRPHLDLYVKAAEKIHVEPQRCIVISHHLDRGYRASELARFRMFLDVEDPFVSSRLTPHPYPTLSEAEMEKFNRDNPVVSPLLLADIPTTMDEIEDVVDSHVIHGSIANTTIKTTDSNTNTPNPNTASRDNSETNSTNYNNSNISSYGNNKNNNLLQTRMKSQACNPASLSASPGSTPSAASMTIEVKETDTANENEFTE